MFPSQRKNKEILAESKLLEYRPIRSSNGTVSERPVIVTEIQLLGFAWPVELTLAEWSDMKFRMLLGREAIRGRLVVDPGRSFLGGRPKRKRRRKAD